MDRSQRSGGDGWSDVEQRFFETAPPDVPLQPAAPLTFDDLEGPLPERRRRRRARPARKGARPERRERWGPARRAAVRGLAATLILLSRLAAATRRGTAFALAFSAVLAREVGRRLVLLAREGAGRLAANARAWRRPLPKSRSVRDLAAWALRLALGPALESLPAERADRGTILAAVAAIVIVVGLATVVGAFGPPLTFVR